MLEGSFTGLSATVGKVQRSCGNLTKGLEVGKCYDATKDPAEEKEIPDPEGAKTGSLEQPSVKVRF